MPTPDLQIYLRPYMTLTFDLLTPDLIVLCPHPVDQLCEVASELVQSFSKYRFHKFGNRRTDSQTQTVWSGGHVTYTVCTNNRKCYGLQWTLFCSDLPKCLNRGNVGLPRRLPQR